MKRFLFGSGFDFPSLSRVSCSRESVYFKKEEVTEMNQIDPLWLAQSKLRRGKLEDCINICNEILSTNPGDQVSTRFMV
jgi:hypothetical protein